MAKKRINSRAKGKRIELEAAHLMTRLSGRKFIRGRQHSGSPDSPDIKEEIPNDFGTIHFEVKGEQKLDLWAALAQATADAQWRVPVVMHRIKEKPFLITMSVDHFISLVRSGLHE